MPDTQVLKRLPPGPPLRAVQMMRYLRDPYAALRRYGAEYGPLFTVQTFRHCVMTGRPDLVRQIITAPVDQYGVNYEPGPARVFGKRSMPMLAGRALRRDRHLLVPPFHGDAMNATGDIIRDVTLETFGRLPVGEAFLVRDVATVFARDVILRGVFGVEAGERLDTFRQAAVEFNQCFEFTAFLWMAAFHFDIDWLPPNRRLATARGRLEVLLRDAIARAQAGALPASAILNWVVAARYDDGAPMEDDVIRDNMVTVLFAGHKVSIASLCLCFHWLHRERRCLDTLLDELAPLGPDADPIAWGALPYLDAVVKETLRLWPRATEIYRLLAQPMQLGGYELPAGTNLTASPAILHYDPDLYPDPDRFRPERFLERRFGPHEFLPFGGGERMCPGSHLSMFELKIVLATLLTRWRYSLLDDGPLKLGRIAGMMMPLTGIRMRHDGAR